MPALLSIVVVGWLFCFVVVAIGYLLYCLRESHLKRVAVYRL